MFHSSRFAQVVTAMIGALFLSTLSLVAAAGPVHAGAPSWIGAAEFKAPTYA
jgi:hypothetical protein